MHTAVCPQETWAEHWGAVPPFLWGGAGYQSNTLWPQLMQFKKLFYSPNVKLLLVLTVRILSLDNNRVNGEAWQLLMKDDCPYVLSVDHFVFMK